MLNSVFSVHWQSSEDAEVACQVTMKKLSALPRPQPRACTATELPENEFVAEILQTP